MIATPIPRFQQLRVDTAPLEAGATARALEFVYTVPPGTDMSGGAVQIDISGWAMGKIDPDSLRPLIT